MPAGSLIALKPFPYASGSIAAGEVFEARSEFDATALIAARLAVREDSISDDDAALPIEQDGGSARRRRRRAREMAAARETVTAE